MSSLISNVSSQRDSLEPNTKHTSGLTEIFMKEDEERLKYLLNVEQKSKGTDSDSTKCYNKYPPSK